VIVNAIWIGDHFPLLQQMCAQSWIDHGHEYHLWVYRMIPNAPRGVIIYDAAVILPGKIHLYQDAGHQGSPVLHANLFRYEFLAKRGGAFIDADTLCLATFDLSDGFVFSSEGTRQRPNFAFVNVPEERTGFARACVTEARQRLSDPSWGGFGPALLAEQIEVHGLARKVLSPEVFCPLNWNKTPQFFESPPPSLDGSLGVHLWQQVLRKNGRDLNATYPADSLWEQWKAKHA